MLSFQERQQADDLGCKKLADFQDLGRLDQAHPGQINQLVGRSEGGASRDGETFPLQSPSVDAAYARRVAVDTHEARDVLNDLRLAVDGAEAADGHELVNTDFLPDAHRGLDVDVSAEHRQGTERDPIGELAVVGDVRARQQMIVAAEPSHTVFLLGAAVDGHPLVDAVVVSDLHPRGRAPVGEILRLASNRDEGTDGVELAHADHTRHADVAQELRPPADLDIGTDHATGADHRITGQPRTRIDAG